MSADVRRQPIVPNGVLGMIIFVLTEIMLFMGMVSAFLITKAAAGSNWPPADQPRLPIETTALNTAVLTLSAAALVWAGIRFSDDAKKALRPMVLALVLGAAFVISQGREWVALIGQGLTFTSSQLGSFFYLIVGMHGLHAVVAIAFLLRIWLRLERGWLQPSQLASAAVFWYFVVGAWPVIYWRVYL